MNTRLRLRGRLALVVCLAIITASLSVFAWSGVYRSLNSTATVDFHVLYTAGQMWNKGLDPYDPHQFYPELQQIAGGLAVRRAYGYYYPPQATVLFSALARLPSHVAHAVVIGLNMAFVIISLAILGLILSRHNRLGMLDFALLATFVSSGFGRMNVREGQISALICVLLWATFVLQQRGRGVLAGLLLAGVTLKPTFLPLYLAFYLLRRAYVVVAVCVVAALVLTALPMALTGRSVPGTMTGWLDALRVQSARGENIDDPSPDASYAVTMHHLAPLVYRIFAVRSPVTTAISWLIVGALCVGGGLLVLRGGGRADGTIDLGLVSALSLVSVYHRAYDDFLLFPGILSLYLAALRTWRPWVRRVWMGVLGAVLLSINLPTDLSARLSTQVPALNSSYVWRVVAPVATWGALVVVGGVFWRKIEESRHIVEAEQIARLERPDYLTSLGDPHGT